MNGSTQLTQFSRVLVLCAHTDDEFGCAGLVGRLSCAGVQVRYVALSRCEESVPAGLPIDILERECRASAAELGIAEEAVSVLRFPVRRFPSVRQDILEELVRLSREYRPDLVLLPSSFDTHQDHAVTYQEGFRAFKHATLLGYELPQNLISFNNSAFVRLDEADVERKIQALSCYRSQGFRPYSARDFILGLARVRGVQCNATFAEAFEAIRLIMG